MAFIYPNWIVSDKIKALTTTKDFAGYSQGEFSKFNLALNVGESEIIVRKNRQLLVDTLNLSQEPHFLSQTHSTRVVKLPTDEIDADASYTEERGQICAILTADCLPVLFAAKDASMVAAAHAGWRGLCNGILENTVKKFKSPPMEIVAWLGPAISQRIFQVGADVKEQFIAYNINAVDAFIRDPNVKDRYLGDLYLLAKQRLLRAGLLVENIYTDDYCTYTQDNKFYSYRRDQGKTGRQVSLIWLE